RFVLRMTAPAKGDYRASGEAKSVSCGIFDYDVVAHHAIRAVVVAYYCGVVLIAHYYLRKDVRTRSEEHTSELQSPCNLVCRLLLRHAPSSILFPYTTLFRSRFVLRMTAPAKGDYRASGEAKSVSCGIFDYDVVAHHAIRAVVVAYYCGVVLIAHYYLRKDVRT